MIKDGKYHFIKHGAVQLSLKMIIFHSLCNLACSLLRRCSLFVYTLSVFPSIIPQTKTFPVSCPNSINLEQSKSKRQHQMFIFHSEWESSKMTREICTVLCLSSYFTSPEGDIAKWLLSKLKHDKNSKEFILAKISSKHH